MKLKKAISTINYDSSIAIYAESPFTPNSESRIGQNQFENGGILDGKEWVINGDSANDRSEYGLEEYRDHDEFEEMVSENISDFLIPQLEEERKDREDLR
ncbi:MAG: hypothetical protein OXG15_12630 [Gammaproteobacteria bacterium]|nr:hypothetical protein [Gammaproteobacteria bacterium]